jgi:hypothetical protein
LAEASDARRSHHGVVETVLLVGKCAVCLPCVQAFYNSTRGRRTAPCAVWLNRGVTTPPRATPLAVLVAACGAGVQGAGYSTGQVRIEGSQITEAEAPPVPSGSAVYGNSPCGLHLPRCSRPLSTASAASLVPVHAFCSGVLLTHPSSNSG